MTEADSGPLSGLRVIDCSGMISGGFATMQLADFGADVVMIEHPTHHDPIRDWTPFEDGISLWWKSLARNKRCITLDLSTDEGRTILCDLARDGDVLIENFRPGTMERWGLGYETLKDENPALIMTRISGYGQTGPRSKMPGFGTVAEAISGFAHVNGFPDREPLLPPISLADMAAAQFAVQATMFALYERAQSGEGQVIDVSLYESLFRMFPGAVEKYDRLGETSERIGNHHANAAPRNVYATADGYIALSASSQSIFENLARAIGHPELIEDERFATNGARVEHATELDTYIAPWIAARTTETVLQELGEGDAVVAPIYDMEDIFADEQYAARDDIIAVEDDDLGRVRTMNTVPKFSRTPGEIKHLGPRHGQHNDEIFLEELGLDREMYDELQHKGIV
ncbi:CaiB/BaiF CoA transferase family protein [Halocatena marina]|uniref:CaiB/BaiF CoA transferase family protein n=1 Tax=Halocatena marina TaxID=2934937 RepID=A0ABD5YME7_9EURY|nr:CoA transferase [Halocatena marina]